MWVGLASSERVMFAALAPVRVGGFQLGHHAVGLTRGFDKYPDVAIKTKYKFTQIASPCPQGAPG